MGRELITMDVIAEEADVTKVSTIAAAQAIMGRLEERAAALRLLAGLDPLYEERYVVERETGDECVKFTVTDAAGADMIGKATAYGAGRTWYVTAAHVDGDDAPVAVASAVCLLLAASVAAEKTSLGIGPGTTKG